MTIPADSLIQGQIVLQQQGQKFSNVLHWTNADDVPTEMELGELTELLNLWVTAYENAVHEDVEFLGAVFSLPQDPMFGTRTITLDSTFGAVSGDLGQTTAFVVIRKYTIIDAAPTRGRVLFGGFPEQFTEDNTLTSNAVLAMTATVNWMHVAAATSENTYQPVVYSRLLDTFEPCVKANLDPVVRSFHGRQATLI